MSIDKFTFISPGIFVSEIDESQNPSAGAEVMGPIIIGRSQKGPAMRPVRVKSYNEFTKIFGNPHPGGPIGGDVWRSGTPMGPTYAPYAAKAWLLAGTAPATFVRLLGEENDKGGTTSGWTTTLSTPNAAMASNGGAYGLFTIDSSSAGTATDPANVYHHTGTLAAVFYIDNGSALVLSGTMRALSASYVAEAGDGGHETPGTAAAGCLIKSVGTNNEYKMELWHGTAKQESYHFDFNATSSMYIRNVFNTNPTLVNSTITDTSTVTANKQRYWLGETFERAVDESTQSKNHQFGMILPLMSGSTHNWADRQDGNEGWVNAQTGWFFSQDYGAHASFSAPETGPIKLFKFHSLDYGSWANSNIKISIENIKAGKTVTNPYGTFTVGVYPADAISSEEALEKFTGCTFDPTSKNYVAKKIGTHNLTWSDSTKKHTQNGAHPNKSTYVRIEMNPILKNMDQKDMLPFGFTGPVRSMGFSYFSGSAILNAQVETAPDLQGGQPAVANRSSAWVTGSNLHAMPLCAAQHITDAGAPGTHVTGPTPALWVGVPKFSGSWEFPATFQRSGSNDGYSYGKDAFFGVQSTRLSSSTQFDPGYGDYTWGMANSKTAGRFDTLSGLPSLSEYAWVFSLDQLSGSPGSGVYHHVSGARANGESITAKVEPVSYKTVLDEVKQFWSPMYGGFDGFNIKEREPFRNSRWDTSTTAVSDYAYHSVERAIHTVEDPEVVECNLMTIPGITNTNLTDKLLGVCATRGDALAIIDIENVFVPDTEDSSTTWSSRLGSVSSAVSSMQSRDLNNSYGCAYYPWVQIEDSTGPSVFIPPSVVALGTLATSEATSELWFAPAGFNRGGLSKGQSSNLMVLNISEKLTSQNRDDLYENNINPIATFPAEGIVIFGQKTLQQTSSALDRINVRRLMIYIKKEISRIAATILFDQNVKLTWDRFTGEAEPFLASVRSRYGLTDFRVVLDDTTTTDDLIDRNILYAKIFLKPARAIEYIALDFTIMRTGASFAD